MFAGAVLPVSRTRCRSLIAADALTSKRCAADRAEVPAATHRTIRPRRSWDNGVVIVSSIAPNRPDSYKSHTPDPVQPRTALANQRLARGVRRSECVRQREHGCAGPALPCDLSSVRHALRRLAVLLPPLPSAVLDH